MALSHSPLGNARGLMVNRKASECSASRLPVIAVFLTLFLMPESNTSKADTANQASPTLQKKSVKQFIVLNIKFSN